MNIKLPSYSSCINLSTETANVKLSGKKPFEVINP